MLKWKIFCLHGTYSSQINGLVQERRSSIFNALEVRLFALTHQNNVFMYLHFIVFFLWLDFNYVCEGYFMDIHSIAIVPAKQFSQILNISKELMIPHAP